mmetsp:Transcript_132964/g.231100  ORF Transcript_132964/g.231100 Transcript_132964/m.231100 type:complete len:370 (-) Transcript_132964:61-1170(-)
MEAFDEILSDWRACKPDGVVLRATHLDDVIARACARVEDARTVSPGRQWRRARALLSTSPSVLPKAGADLRATSEVVRADQQTPPLVELLHLDGKYKLPDDRNAPASVIHFFYFWQAFDALRRCLRRTDDAADLEPMAGEAAALRDALLERYAAGRLTLGSLVAELTSIRKSSKDPSAWACLNENVLVTVHLETSAEPTARDKPMSLDRVSALLVGWLSELTEDYCRGRRKSAIQTVCDVLRCSVQDACVHLGSSGWDTESALRLHYVNASTLQALHAGHLAGAWNSQHARFSSGEQQCSICVAHFTIGSEPVVTRCCFQTLCVNCIKFLSDDKDQLRCPFCRRMELRPELPGQPLVASDNGHFRYLID